MKVEFLKKHKFILQIAILIILASAAVFATYAWLVLSTSSTNKLVISDINASCLACFIPSSREDNTITFDEFNAAIRANGSAFTSGELISVELNDKTAPNYIGNLRVVIKYTGSSPVYARMKVIDGWVRDNEFIASDLINFTTGSSTGNLAFADGNILVMPSYNTEAEGEWYDNRGEDSAYYYTVPIYPSMLGDNDYNQVFAFLINGVTKENINLMGNLGNGLELNLLLETEMVQPNRYREFWDIETLPWLQE